MECKTVAINCPCTYSGCNKQGHCCECVEYHRNKQQLPACYFSKDEEKKYNRSIENFIKLSKF